MTHEHSNTEETDVLLSLTGITTDDDHSLIERTVAQALHLDSNKVSILDADDETQVMLVVYSTRPPQDLAHQVNQYISNNKNVDWHCSVVDMEEEVEIDEGTAFDLWRDMPEASRTTHLPLVPSPDGDMISPTHDHNDIKA
ncbi:MAG: hypothetical protein SGARI_002017, partial [Bacillariaceae sp.]